jgi:hypothetical protein
MTETAWLSCSELGPMLRFLDERASMRKMRLFTIACCHRVEHLMTDEDEAGRQALALSDKMVEKHVNSEEVRSAFHDAWNAAFRLTDGFREEPDLQARSNAIAAAYNALHETVEPIWHSHASKNVLVLRSDIRKTPWHARSAAAFGTGAWLASSPWKKTMDDEERQQIAILRDVFGNPFRKVMIDPSWLDLNDGIVRNLARAFYHEGADSMPPLTDALIAAGCTSAHILDHCRQPGEHVRGCWVIDLLLGKK